ncbi:MAG: hypothetical protein JW888_16645 [Pirellulales bacterium]|nr:hypothetical protein [Pirellulales bacterium]
MDRIDKQVRRARQRLSLQRFLETCAWTCTGTLGASVALVLVGRFWLPELPPWLWPAGAVVLGIAVAWVRTVAAGCRSIDAAVEIDQRFDLKERVSSAWAISETERQSQAGQALIADAARRVERIDVSARMRITPSRRLLYPLAPAALTLILIALVGPAENDHSAQAKGTAARKQFETSTRKLQRRLTEQHRKAETRNFSEIENILELLQQDLKRFRANPPADRKKALMKLNDWTKQLKDQRDKAAGADRLRDQLKKLKNLASGPGERLAKAMKQGDFGKAAEELERLREQLASENLDEPQRQQLAQQMAQMARKLEKIAEAHRKMEQTLENEIRKLRDIGQSEQASKFEEQLARLRRQLPRTDMLDKLAGQLKECSDCCKEDRLGEAHTAMQELSDHLGELQQESSQLEMLDEALDQMAQCRGEMCCPHCQGTGCPLCETDQAGSGLRAGKDHVPGGPRGKQLNAAFHDSKVAQEVGAGPMVVSGYAPGSNRKGNVGELIREQLETTTYGEADPTTTQQLPREYRKHVEEYRNRFGEGK